MRGETNCMDKFIAKYKNGCATFNVNGNEDLFSIEETLINCGVITAKENEREKKSKQKPKTKQTNTTTKRTNAKTKQTKKNGKS